MSADTAPEFATVGVDARPLSTYRTVVTADGTLIVQAEETPAAWVQSEDPVSLGEMA
ncbi:MAG: hypothetical protein ABEH77_03995 [Halobacteriaceae archaeon]